MTISRTAEARAADPKTGMTLAELGVFIDEARAAELPGETLLSVRANFTGGIKRIWTRA